MSATVTKPTTFAELLGRAEQAHAAGQSWATFWPTVADNVRSLQPWNRQKYHRLVRLLLHTLVSGDADGQEPIGSGITCFDMEDES